MKILGNLHTEALNLSVQISEHKTEAMVMRSGKWVETASAELVPGDVLKIKSDWLLPCDAVIIKGAPAFQ